MPSVPSPQSVCSICGTACRILSFHSTAHLQKLQDLQAKLLSWKACICCVVRHSLWLQIALSNLDTVLLEARGVLETIGPHLLAEMEDIQKAQFDPPCPIPGASVVSKPHVAVLTRRPTAAASESGQLAVLVLLSWATGL